MGVPATGAQDLRYAHAPEAGTVAWLRAHTGFGLSGAFSEETLIDAARLVQAQLS